MLNKAMYYISGPICSWIQTVAMEIQENRWTQNTFRERAKRTACELVLETQGSKLAAEQYTDVTF